MPNDIRLATTEADRSDGLASMTKRFKGTFGPISQMGGCNMSIGQMRRGLGHLWIVAVWCSVGVAEARAGFISYGNVTAAASAPGETYFLEMTNTANLSGILLQLHNDSGFFIARGFAQVSPRPAGAPLTTSVVSFHASAFAHANAIGYTGAAPIGAGTAVWEDGLRFASISAVPPPVHGWAAVVRLNGSLDVTGVANASMKFDVQLGNGIVNLSHDLNSAGTVTFHDETLLVAANGGDPFDPNGVGLSASLVVGAYAQSFDLLGQPIESEAEAGYAHTVNLLGIVALDANGNILPGVGDLVRVTSDSGLNYPILDSIPTANGNAVPEPSGLVLLAMFLVVLILAASTCRRHRGVPCPAQ